MRRRASQSRRRRFLEEPLERVNGVRLLRSPLRPSTDGAMLSVAAAGRRGLLHDGAEVHFRLEAQMDK